MKRGIVALICVVLGLLLFGLGLQTPAHLRAVDAVVLQQAGRGTPSLIETGVALTKDGQLGAAQLFAAAAESAWLPQRDPLIQAVQKLERDYPGLQGAGKLERDSLGALLESDRAMTATPTNPASPRILPFTEFIIRADVRAKTLAALQHSRRPFVESLLRLRAVTNTVLFPPSASASGQALDAAIGIAGLLADHGHLSAAWERTLTVLALDANAGQSQPLEQVLLDLMALGRRFNWGQLTAFVEPINSAESLHALTDYIQRGDSVPVIYAAVCLTQNPADVAKYLARFSATGREDLRLSLNYQVGGVTELLHRQQQLCHSPLCRQLAAAGLIPGVVANFAWQHPALALAFKWLLYLLGGFFLAAAFHYTRRIPVTEQPLEVRGFHFIREIIFALGFLLVVLLVSEPFLAQGSQKAEPPFRLHLPMVGGAAPAGNSLVHGKTLMNPGILLTLLLFFVLQGLIYLVCLVKLAEIRRQRVPPRIKLKLLENEDHLFDAGLYLGFVGTIVSLILVSLNVIHFSLMAAYSATCFGIVFVVIFKIFHLRPTRRKLLLEAEAAAPEAATPSTSTRATPV